MNDSKRWILGAVLGAAALGLIVKARGVLSAQAPPPVLRYQTRCAVLESNALEGYVSNLSEATYQISGEVRFNFFSANSMSHPQILVQAYALVPAGETRRVARTSMPFQLNAGEICSFEVAAAIRKLTGG